MNELRVTVPMARVASHVTMHVVTTGVRTYRWRLRAATWLIKLAARVAGVGLVIEGPQ